VSPFNAFQPKSSLSGVNSDEITEEDSSSRFSSCPESISLHGHVGFVSVAQPLERSVTRNTVVNVKKIDHSLTAHATPWADQSMAALLYIHSGGSPYSI
jgi:hypothetical protein